LTALLHGI